VTGAVSGPLPDRLPDRKEAEVRRMLTAPRPPVPADLAARAAARGRRLLHRRRLLRLALCAVLLAAAVALGVWVAARWPTPPSDPPPLGSWRLAPVVTRGPR
jgi:ferric-dicitrate binding protein FerR (iron transport regulator)